MKTSDGEIRFCPGCPMAGGCEGDITGSKVLRRKVGKKEETLVSLTCDGYESSAFRVNISPMLGRLAVSAAVAECRGPVHDYTVRVPDFTWPTFKRHFVSSSEIVCTAAEKLRTSR